MSFRALLREVLPIRTLLAGCRRASEGALQEMRRVGWGVLEGTVGTGSFSETAGARLDPTGKLSLRCTCLEFAERDFCPHLWALATEADRRGVSLGGGDAVGEDEDGEPLALRLARAAGDEDDDGRVRGLLERYDVLLRLADPPDHAFERRIQQLAPRPASFVPPFQALQSSEGRFLYVIDGALSRAESRLRLEVLWQPRLDADRWGEPRAFAPNGAAALERASEEDWEALACLAVLTPSGGTWWRSYAPSGTIEALSHRALEGRLPALCRGGRLAFRATLDSGPLRFLRLDDGPPWVLGLALSGSAAGRSTVRGFLARGEGGERIDLAEPDLLFASGLLVRGESLARFDPRGAMGWALSLRREGALEVPAARRAHVEKALLALSGAPLLEIQGLEPPRTVAPRPHVRIQGGEDASRGRKRVPCRISFDYDGLRVRASDPSPVLLDPRSGPIRRDREAERAALRAFVAAGGKPAPRSETEHEGLAPTGAFAPFVRALLEAGWQVDAEGLRYRPSGAFRLRVRSGVDWFDLEGEMEFDGQPAPLPALLEAARQGSRTVRLADGSLGLLPERWLEGWQIADAVAEVEGEGLRFRGSQGWLLDALLAEQAGVDVDAGFERARARVRAFRGVAAAREPRSFAGTLRPYQREGLGWLRFLRETGLGGCLADDMGLGKTVQVLALLDAVRAARGTRKPSLVVAPRSVVHNWVDEATRFAPHLRVFDHTGPARARDPESLAAHDVVLATYGTLRRDIAHLRTVAFDVVVLDEAQAIKNDRSQSAKAARLLRADHRLALSGTPIENHLGELWSLFEFLNPGMLGRASAFGDLTGARDGRTLDGAGRARLARAIAPFVLRRTKEQVLPDLPAKSEQVLHCEMGAVQRRDYDRIRDHVRTTLLAQADRGSLEGMKIHVLEGLLRLRQAACHPGLMDAERQGESSAKLETLLPHLEEVVEGGHKALVFSQFTKFLAIVRDRLDARGIAYEYLDGGTRDRKRRVEHFQSKEGPPLFLVSLRAGGLGLNLTAADYVFLLDPWWNPAVERQAVDRAHRIGQERPVMAYRLLCKDTVEEKVLELQREKRALAEAVIGEDASVLRSLTREDLEALLS